MNHSPEPWRYDDKAGCITDADSEGVCGIYMHAAPADLERIALCVNFCRSLSKEFLREYAAENRTITVTGEGESVSLMPLRRVG